MDTLRILNVNKKYMKKCILNNISMELGKGRLTALIGESGGGKTTLCKIIIGLENCDSGEVLLFGHKLKELRKRKFNECADIQYIFQDPYSSIEDESTVYGILAEPQKICRRHKRESLDMETALKLAGINTDLINKQVQSLSGGQRQRVAIARALITMPAVIIADESISMLDKNSARDILEIFTKIKREMNICILLITHGIELLQEFADDIIVMDKGNIVECGDRLTVLNNPKSKYLKELLQSYKILRGVSL